MMRMWTKLGALLIGGAASLGAGSAEAQVIVGSPFPVARRQVIVDPGVVTTSYATTTTYGPAYAAPVVVPGTVRRVYTPTTVYAPATTVYTPATPVYAPATIYAPTTATVVSPAYVPTAAIYEPAVVYPAGRYRRMGPFGWRSGW